MKLYEVNQAIEELLCRMEPDPETGEVPMELEELYSHLDALQLERGRILEYLAKMVLNCRSEAFSLREEEKRLAERRRKLERRDERLLRILDRECAGEKTDCGVATVSYRNASHVEISDSGQAVNWLKENGHRECYRVPEPEINKTDVRKLISSGAKIPGVVLVQEKSCSLK